MSSNKTSIDALQQLNCVKNLNPIKRDFVLKLENRKKITNYLSICEQKGFQKFCEICSPNPENREIIKELISKI